MKKAVIATIAAAMLATSALGLVACSKDYDESTGGGDPDPTQSLTPTAYTVTFDANGGTWTDATVKKTATTAVGGGTVTFPDAPTKTDGTFVGWFTAKSGGTQRQNTYTFDADTTLYAQWSATATTLPGDDAGDGAFIVTVHYRFSDGSYGAKEFHSDRSHEMTAEGKITADNTSYLVTQHSIHYTDFTGYYDAETDGNPVDLANMKFTKTTEVWAHYGSGGGVSTPSGNKVACSDSSTAYVVGQFSGDVAFDWDNGYAMTLGASGFDGSSEWVYTITLNVGDTVKIRLGGDGYGFDYLGDAASKAMFTDTDGDNHNMQVNTSGTYSFYFKVSDHKIYVAQ